MRTFFLAVVKLKQLLYFFLLRFNVRVVKSNRAGVGKSLFVSRVGGRLDELIKRSRYAYRQVTHSADTNVVVTIPLHGNEVQEDKVVKSLLPYERTQEDAIPRIYHFDLASTVRRYRLHFIFLREKGGARSSM